MDSSACMISTHATWPCNCRPVPKSVWFVYIFVFILIKHQQNAICSGILNTSVISRTEPERRASLTVF